MGIISIKYAVSLFLNKEKIRVEQNDLIMREMTWQEHLDYEREVGHVVIDPPRVKVKPGEHHPQPHNSL